MPAVDHDIVIQSGSVPWLQRFWVRVSLVWGTWAIVAFFFATQIYTAYYKEQNPIPFRRALFMQGVACFLWALATPFVLWLARRFCIDRNNWLRRVPLHFLLALTLSIPMITLDYVVHMLYMGLGNSLTMLRGFQFVFYNLDRCLLIYWVIVLISHAFNYYHSYREGELKASQLRTQLAQSQLEALKMQLHPHFLFNTLHSISALLNQDVEAARRMISRLGDFLRLTLENVGTQEVTLKRELEFLNGYLEIERIRFQDRLTTMVKVDPELLDHTVPNLILQPIVENALRHAIANSNGGRIEIVVEPNNGMLRIRVKDNGPGLRIVPTVADQSKHGIGLANTKARLHQLYGSAHRLELENDPAGGLVVTMELPQSAPSNVTPLVHLPRAS
jgi:two-component system, LytTR family, sensor kinase